MILKAQARTSFMMYYLCWKNYKGLQKGSKEKSRRGIRLPFFYVHCWDFLLILLFLHFLEKRLLQLHIPTFLDLPWLASHSISALQQNHSYVTPSHLSSLNIQTGCLFSTIFFTLKQQFVRNSHHRPPRTHKPITSGVHVDTTNCVVNVHTS